jgi:hypothetical protein
MRSALSIVIAPLIAIGAQVIRTMSRCQSRATHGAPQQDASPTSHAEASAFCPSIIAHHDSISKFSMAQKRIDRCEGVHASTLNAQNAGDRHDTRACSSWIALSMRRD